MRFTINKKDMLRGLNKVQGITGRRTNLPITSAVLISAEDDRVSLLASDLETGFEGFYAAQVAEEGKAALPARKLFEIIKDFPTDEIIFNEVENRWIEISGTKDNKAVEYHVVGMDPDEFPDIARNENESSFDVEASVFKEMIDKTIITGVSDDTRAHLAGLYLERFEEEGKQIFRVVSTDGHRLLKIDRIYEEGNLPLGEGIIVPKKGMAEVVKLLENGGTAQIGFKESNFVVKKENETIIIRLMEGDFPDYREVIPNLDDTFMKIPKQSFMAMLKRMSILSTERYRGVIFNIKPDKLEITATNPELGDSREDISVEFNGEAFEVAFNPKYFIDSLNVMQSDNIMVKIKDENNPCIIEEEDDPLFLSVIMPMRI